MGRTILAVIVGLVVAGLIVAGIETVGHTLNPPPPGTDLTQPGAMETLMASLPTTALVIIVLAWALGSIGGGFTAAKISRQHKRGAALAVGIAMVLLVASNFFVIPHPLWMMVVGVLVPIPLALVGRKLATI